MNKYFVNLNLPNSPLRDDFELPRIRHTKFQKDILTPDMIDFFEKRNLLISFVEIIYSEPYLESTIHTDGVPGDYSKINFILGAPNGIMSWYHQNNKEYSLTPNVIGRYNCLFETDEVTLEYFENIRVSLVQVGVPHNVKNFQDDRWAVGVVYRNKDTGNRLTMSESKELFKDVIRT
jgi:hypothetical protein